MDTILYYQQLIPALPILILLVANLVRKRSICCLSSIALFYTFFAFAGAVVMIEMPRNGYAYVNPEAMCFLAICYSLFCLPIMFYRDGKLGEDSIFPVDECRFRFLALALIVLTVPAAAYFLFKSLPSLVSFLGAGVPRAQFRTAVDISRADSFLGVLMNFGAVFSYCAMFAAIYGIAFERIGGGVFMLLLFGGMSFAISMLENVARSGVLECGMFIFVVFVILWPRMHVSARVRMRRIVCVIASLLLLPFLLLTIVRFCGGGGEDEPFGYTLFSYFSTGPYSFSADYAVRVECGLPPTKGALTCPYLPWILDKIQGTSDYKDQLDELDDRLQNNAPEYLDVCEGYAGEFKTIVGSFLLDYSPLTVFFIMLFICLLFVKLFRASRNRPVDLVFAAIYFFMVFMAPIGYVFATRYRMTMLLALVLFAFLLVHEKTGYGASSGRSLVDKEGRE